MLTKFGVFRDVALNARAVGLQLFAQSFKLVDEVLDFPRRGLRYPAQQRAEAVGRNIVIADFDWKKGLGGPGNPWTFPLTSISDDCLISADPIGLASFMTLLLTQ